MWVVFWTTGVGLNYDGQCRDHFVISEDETDARLYYENLLETVNDLLCAGIGPITNSTEHWHTHG